MIKITRSKYEVTAVYINDFDKVEGGVHRLCKDIDSAKELAAKLRQTVKNGYGFAIVRAVAEGDQNEYPPIN